MKEKGIILITSGHPYYGKLAASLAASILAHEFIPITLYVHGNSDLQLTTDERLLFDSVKPLQDKYIMNGSKVLPFMPKVCLNKLSPYKNTIYLDVDIAWNPKRSVNELFKSLNGKQFVTICEGYNERINKHYQTWANIDDIRKVYNITDIPQTRTEFIYFEKCELTDAIFSKALQVFKNPMVKFTQYSNHIPDELAFNIALAVNKHHLDVYCPVYWAYLHKGQQWLNYYAYSMGGAITTTEQKRIYNGLIHNAYSKLGMKMSYQFRDKKYFNKKLQMI